MHRLLKHQIKRSFGKDFKIESSDENLQKLLQDISNSYEMYEKDNKLIEHVLEVNSQELEGTNKKLKHININLENDIKKEVQKSSLKDKKLIEQSRIAQEKLNKSIQLFGENVIASNTDVNGKIIYVSQALCKTSGYTQAELLNQPHSILRHPDMDPHLFKEIWLTIQTGKVWKGELKNKKKDGSYYWVSTSIAPSFDENNNITGYTSIRHDITAQKAKEEFMANMSHELRTPLNSILGFSSILTQKQKDPKFSKYSKQINDSAKSLLSLINDILDLSKIQDSKFTMESYKFNAYKEARLSSQQIEGLISHKFIHFNYNINKNLQGIFIGDWKRINQIILNLISNAVKFTPKDGKISVDLDYIKNIFIISVKDNGIGMNPAVQDKIFKPFEQADGSTTRKYGGTGLGLSITQTLVEMMKGNIELESKEGKGTTFTIKIPLSKLSSQAELITDSPISIDNKKDTLTGHVLVAEDNQTNQTLIALLLKEFGITCDIAEDGVQATRMYNPKKHLLILMDENMPNMNGIEAMKIIKKTDENVPIIALTANAMQGDRLRFLDAGMDEYIQKPIDENSLYAILVKYLKST